MNVVNAQFLSQTPIEQLRSSLVIADSGDIPSGHLLWGSIFSQIDSLALTPYLAPDESSYLFKFLIAR